MSDPRPLVAVVGRPNVGKSTLFNRLLGERRAIVHDQPGVTRDRISARWEAAPDRFLDLVDTGGLVPGDDPMGLGEQVLVAARSSSLLVLVVDGAEGLTQADEIVWESLRPLDRPTILAVNKADVKRARAHLDEFHRLGIDRVLFLSAEHGRGVGDLADAILEALPTAPEPASEPELPSLAIVGRPNVGKSSLLNAILGDERVLVSPVAGTTRDPVDTVVERAGARYRFVDTAGIRRRARGAAPAESIAILMARRQVQRADVAILVVDATEGVTTGDLQIAGSVWEEGRAAVVAINKWDLVTPEVRRRLEESWPRLDQVLSSPHRVNLSAKTGRGVESVFGAAIATLAAHRTRLSTGQVNRHFERFVEEHQAPVLSGRPWKFFYATQVATGPPTFMLFANRALPRSHAYRRYLENRVRRELGLEGVPVRLVVRRRS